MNERKTIAIALLLLGIAALSLPAASQQAPKGPTFAPPPLPAQEAQPKAAAPKAAEPKAAAAKAQPKAAAAPADPLIGTWAGPVIQVGHETGYTIMLTVQRGQGATEYPELDCSGRLTRVAGSGPYVFYVERITRGRHDGGGRCPDGTLTIARIGDHLAISWFGTAQGQPINAYGSLTRRAQ